MIHRIDVKKVSLAIFACLLWGSAFPVLKLTYEELGIGAHNVGAKLTLAGMRFGLASILILLFFKIKNKNIIIKSKSELLNIIILGLFQTAILYFFFYIGISNTSGVKSAVLSQTGIFFVAIIAHFVFIDDKFNKNKAIGLLCGLLGIIVLNINSANTKDLFDINFFGEGFLIISGLASATGTILAKKLTHKYNPIKVTGWQMFFGSTLLLILGITFNNGFITGITLKALLLYIYSAFLSAIAFGIWYSLLKENKASEITIYKFYIPIFGAFLSALLIPNETISTTIFIGLIMVVLGIYLTTNK